MARRAILILLLLLTLAAVLPSSTLASNETGPDRVYFPESGHYLSLGFLDYWHVNGGIEVFGYPITDEMSDPATGQTVQYFERAIFEYRPEAPSDARVQLRPLPSSDRLQTLVAYNLSQQRWARLASFSTVRIPTSQPFAPVGSPLDESMLYFEEAGHTLGKGFKDFWERHGGATVFGYPTTEEFVDPITGHTVQLFERAIFEWPSDLPESESVQLREIGVSAAKQAGINIAPQPQSSDTPTYAPDLWQVIQPASPTALTTPLPGAPTGAAKWIEVDLSQQYIRAWEHETLVFGHYVSTGVAKHATPTGYFRTFAKLRYDDMTNGPAAPPEDFYDLKDVPNVMYFAAGGYAIHGTYWHNNFGTPQSHGCVNMTIGGSGWMFDWAPYATLVWVHQ
jgi:lipoprotein-anchoring transpeptidase ErfK/SrfK